jgi:hypothetical protein
MCRMPYSLAIAMVRETGYSGHEMRRFSAPVPMSQERRRKAKECGLLSVHKPCLSSEERPPQGNALDVKQPQISPHRVQAVPRHQGFFMGTRLFPTQAHHFVPGMRQSLFQPISSKDFKSHPEFSERNHFAIKHLLNFGTASPKIKWPMCPMHL